MSRDGSVGETRGSEKVRSRGGDRLIGAGGGREGDSGMSSAGSIWDIPEGPASATGCNSGERGRGMLRGSNDSDVGGGGGGSEEDVLDRDVDVGGGGDGEDGPGTVGGVDADDAADMLEPAEACSLAINLAFNRSSRLIPLLAADLGEASGRPSIEPRPLLVLRAAGPFSLLTGVVLPLADVPLADVLDAEDVD